MERFRIYLDTNIIHGWFRKYIDSKRKVIKFTEPKILEFIFNLKNEYIISNITKTEIFRYLSAEWNAPESECNEAWNEFTKTYNVTYVLVNEINFEELIKVCLIVKTKKKTLINLMHLQISKRGNIKFLTGEEKLISKYKQYYDETLSYEDLRKKFNA